MSEKLSIQSIEVAVLAHLLGYLLHLCRGQDSHAVALLSPLLVRRRGWAPLCLLGVLR